MTDEIERNSLERIKDKRELRIIADVRVRDRKTNRTEKAKNKVEKLKKWRFNLRKSLSHFPLSFFFSFLL